MKPFLSALAAATILLPVPASAYNFRDGNGLHDLCSAQLGNMPKTEQLSLCIGYIEAIFDASWAESFRSGMKADCLPENVTQNQVTDIAIQYIRDHPENRHSLAYLMVREALHAAFPQCIVDF